MAKTEQSLFEEETTNKQGQTRQEAGFGVILGFGAYFIILSLLLLYVIIQIWPTNKTSESPIILFGFIKLPVGKEMIFILIVAIMGALGSLIHAMTSFATYVGNKQFYRNWIWWFILRPFIGTPLALIFYFVIRGGLFTISTGANAVSPFGIAGLAGLVGMFSKQAIDKLREVFENLFKTTQPDQRAEKLQDHSG